MLLTIAMAFVRNAVNPGESELYNAFDSAFLSASSCARSARAVGEMLSLIVSVETRPETFYSDLTFSLASLDE